MTTVANLKKYCSIFLTLILLSSAKLSAGGIAAAPLLRWSYDLNLGHTFGIGCSIVKFDGGIGAGPYFLYSYSRKNRTTLPPILKGLSNIFGFDFPSPATSGSSYSLGYYGGVGLASFRFGINHMILNNEGSYSRYWGAEVSPIYFVLNLVGGAMYNKQSNSFKPNLVIGRGFF